MGFYDARCAISGLSTRAAKVQLILLREDNPGGTLQPVALPIHGSYDRLGSIDNIRPSWNVDMLELAFMELLDGDSQDSRLQVHHKAFSHRPVPLDNMEQILAPIERGMTLGVTSMTWDGHPLRFMLVIDRIYDAVVATVSGNRTARWSQVQEPVLLTLPTEQLLEQAFQGVEPAPTLYALLSAISSKEERQVRADLIRFLQFRAFVDQRHHYSYEKSPGQHYQKEEAAFVSEAKERFALYPHLLSAVKESAAAFFAIL